MMTSSELMNRSYLTVLDKQEMDTIDFKGQIADIIAAIKESKTIVVSSWGTLAKEYDPKQHEIVTDTTSRKDKIHADGTTEKVARVTYGMQKLSAKRMTQMAFAIPVKRLYKTDNDATKKLQADAIEAVYTKARIDTVNRKRMNAYFAACEIMTVWYPVEGKNKHYGFDSSWKLKCNTFSPMDSKFSMLSSANIFPVFDKYKDLIGLAYEYKVTEKSKEMTYFHIYTSEQEKVFRQEGADTWEDLSGEDSSFSIGKIPALYLWRPIPIWEDITGNVHQMELSLSRESDILKRNSAPILKVKGKLIGGQPANEVAREVYQVDGDGDISYVTWSQQIDAMKYYTDTLKQNMEEELQLPNLSFDNVKLIGAITEGARKTLLTDAHLKVGDESGDMIEFFDRECNIIKAFLGEINSSWKNMIMDLEVEHIITPFIQNDESAQIDKITKATQKPVMSQKTGIEKLGLVTNIEQEYQQLRDEEKRSNDSAVFETAGTNE